MRKRSIGDRIPELADQYARERKDQPGFSDLEFLGAGGEQVVFAVKQKEGKDGDYRNLVMKADMRHLRMGVLQTILSRIEIGFMSPDLASRLEKIRERLVSVEQEQENMKAQVKREENFFRSLKTFFPAETILTSRASIRTVPITPGVVHEILQEYGLQDVSPNEMLEVSTIVHYQRPIPQEAMSKMEGGESSDAHSLGFRYAERYDIASDDYLRLNLMTHGIDEPFDMELFSSFLHDDTVRLIETARSDNELRDVLRALVATLICFSNETFQMLDLAGAGNMRVFRDKENKWRYLLVDPYVMTRWTGAHEASREPSSDSREIERSSIDELLNAVNYERTVNGLARLFDIKERMSLSKSELPKRGIDALNHLELLRENKRWPDRFLPRLRTTLPDSEEKTVKLPQREV